MDLANLLDLTLYGNSIYYDYATRCSNEEICCFFLTSQYFSLMKNTTSILYELQKIIRDKAINNPDIRPWHPNKIRV